MPSRLCHQQCSVHPCLRRCRGLSLLTLIRGGCRVPGVPGLVTLRPGDAYQAFIANSWPAELLHRSMEVRRGPSALALRLPRPPASSTPILSAASSRLRLPAATSPWAGGESSCKTAGKLRIEGKGVRGRGQRRHALPLQRLSHQNLLTVNVKRAEDQSSRPFWPEVVKNRGSRAARRVTASR